MPKGRTSEDAEPTVLSAGVPEKADTKGDGGLVVRALHLSPRATQEIESITGDKGRKVK